MVGVLRSFILLRGFREEGIQYIFGFYFDCTCRFIVVILGQGCWGYLRRYCYFIFSRFLGCLFFVLLGLVLVVVVFVWLLCREQGRFWCLVIFLWKVFGVGWLEYCSIMLFFGCMCFCFIISVLVLELKVMLDSFLYIFFYVSCFQSSSIFFGKGSVMRVLCFWFRWVVRWFLGRLN